MILLEDALTTDIVIPIRNCKEIHKNSSNLVFISERVATHPNDMSVMVSKSVLQFSHTSSPGFSWRTVWKISLLFLKSSNCKPGSENFLVLGMILVPICQTILEICELESRITRSSNYEILYNPFVLYSASRPCLSRWI